MPTVQGEELSRRPDRCGPLRTSHRDAAVSDLVDELEGSGYLFLPGFFGSTAVEAARDEMAAKLAAAGLLDDRNDPSQLIARPGATTGWVDDLAAGNAALHELLYGASTLAFFSSLFAEPARPYDFTWARAMGNGPGTAPHCDVVFMGRGTSRVLTMWVALCDIPVDVGGLAVLERSHDGTGTLHDYRTLDVDTHCEGTEPTASLGAGGSIPCDSPLALADELDRRWVWGDYCAGDVFVFGLQTVHASLDNASDQIRISTDSRYQPASEPIDDRWVGDPPIAHSLAAQRARIC